MIKMIKKGLLLSGLLLLVACGASNPPVLSQGHLGSDAEALDTIPAPVIDVPVLPEPEQRPNLETYTVIVNQVPVRELLFSMARDAKLNLDIDSGIKGKVTMNAIDQTLPQILERLTRQTNVDYRLEDETLYIRADKPRLQLYDVNYLNMSRLSKGSVEVATEISSTASSVDGGSGGGNNSSSIVENESNNEFWKTLIMNIAGVLGEESKASDDIQQISHNILVNRETGVMGVRATSRQHKQVRELLDKVVGSAQRQVMIEATIAEVKLSDHYQAGIDWSMMRTDSLGNIDQISQNLIGGNLGATPFFQISGAGTTSNGEQLGATLKALETFGDVKVLSSPKVMALNNQTAMLKVVDNEVYFSVEVTPEKRDSNNVVITPALYETEINTVPVGFVMTVMPFIDKNDVVTLNVRPTISRIVGTAVDPNPDLTINNEVPIIQVREIESVLKVNNGDTAVIGGLMQDQINKQQSGVPILSSIPFIGALFSYQDDEYVKSELVIFIRPVVVHEASLDGDLKEYRKYLMDDFDATPVQPE